MGIVPNSQLTIHYADSALIVLDKPGGLLAVPGRGPENQDCVVSRVKKQFSDCIKQPSVHRLDMATSGLMVLARTAAVHRDLSMQFADRQVEKRYIALVKGVVSLDSGLIELAFRLDPENRPYQVYDPVKGKMGLTRWQKVSVDGRLSRIEFMPETGRTHQLRVHAAHELGLNCPIVGDSLYGDGRRGQQMMLHAVFLSFMHPQSKKQVSFESTAPF